MKNSSYLFLLLVMACSSSEDYYPQQHPEMSAGIYAKYKGRLDTAYLESDHGQIAIQLANLRGDTNKIFEELNKGAIKDDEFCHEVYQWQRTYDEHNFAINLHKADTAKFRAAYQICIDRMGGEVFQERQAEKELAYAARMAARETLDSTKFDLVLIDRLLKLRAEDQEIRVKRSAKNISVEDKAEFSKIMQVKDALNLIEVENIIQEYGYPSRERVGDLTKVIWLVLHHQGDLAIRNKYEPIIEGNTSNGLLKTYRMRSENIRLRNEQ